METEKYKGTIEALAEQRNFQHRKEECNYTKETMKASKGKTKGLEICIFNVLS